LCEEKSGNPAAMGTRAISVARIRSKNKIYDLNGEGDGDVEIVLPSVWGAWRGAWESEVIFFRQAGYRCYDFKNNFA
jgi:hypothetical protein